MGGVLGTVGTLWGDVGTLNGSEKSLLSSVEAMLPRFQPARPLYTDTSRAGCRCASRTNSPAHSPSEHAPLSTECAHMAAEVAHTLYGPAHKGTLPVPASPQLHEPRRCTSWRVLPLTDLTPSQRVPTWCQRVPTLPIHQPTPQMICTQHVVTRPDRFEPV